MLSPVCAVGGRSSDSSETNGFGSVSHDSGVASSHDDGVKETPAKEKISGKAWGVLVRNLPGTQ